MCLPLQNWTRGQQKTNVCRLLSFYILAYNPKWVLNAARQSYCNSWMYSLSPDKYRPLTPPFHCTCTQKIETNFPEGPTPTFIHLPPPVPIHSAFPPIMWIELSILSLLSNSRTFLQKACRLSLSYRHFPPLTTGSLLLTYKHDNFSNLKKKKANKWIFTTPRIYVTL